MKKILAFAMAAVLMLGLAACGGSGASAPASSAAGSASASSGASGQDSAGGASIVEEIQEKGVLTMMTATGFPPFEYLGEDGKPAGVDIDLAQLVADELGVELEVLDMDFNLLIESLKSGKGQLIAAGMTATPERAEQIDFSITYTLNGLILLVPKGSDIKTADDLAGKNIAVQESTTAHIYAQEELGIEPLAFKNANECATAVMGGKRTRPSWTRCLRRRWQWRTRMHWKLWSSFSPRRKWPWAWPRATRTCWRSSTVCCRRRWTTAQWSR